VDTQNARIRTASIVTGIEPESAQSGGSRALATARDHDAVLWRLSNVSDLIADYALVNRRGADSLAARRSTILPPAERAGRASL
jgi:hypothetical protein